MRVESLIIWQEESDTESSLGADGLYDMHLEKCGTIELWKGYPPTNIYSDTGVPTAQVADGIGFYAVLHNLGYFTGLNSNVPDGAAFISKVLKPILQDDLANLTKLVFVACLMAPTTSQIAQFSGGQTIDQIASVQENLLGSRSYMIDVLLNLNALGVRPEIVGWDDFISVAPASPGNNRNVYNAELTAPLASKQLNSDLRGKKYVMYPHGNGVRYGLVSPEYRAAHKRTFAITDGGRVQITGPGGWSDDI